MNPETLIVAAAVLFVATLAFLIERRLKHEAAKTNYSWRNAGGAWLYIDEDGRVMSRVYSADGGHTWRAHLGRRRVPAEYLHLDVARKAVEESFA